MINDEIIAKFVIKRMFNGHSLGFTNWVDYARLIKTQLSNCMSGFPGIGKNDLDIIDQTEINKGDRVILDDNFDMNFGINTDHAPILGQILDQDGKNILFSIDGIGAGTDFSRDPDRNLRWGQVHEIDISPWKTILRLNSKPRDDGGSIYYYYNKHIRDSRW